MKREDKSRLFGEMENGRRRTMGWSPSLATILVLLLSTLHEAHGYPNGAPKSHKVCKSLRPHHKGALPQKGRPPYSVATDTAKIPEGGSLKVTLSSHAGVSYKGFMMQARPAKGNSKLLGKFTILDVNHSKTIDCYDAANNTVTHSSAVLKNTTIFKWTAPPNFKGPIHIVATVVQNFSIYWLQVTTKVVVGGAAAGDLAGKSTEAWEPPRNAETLLTNKPSTSDKVLHSVYEGCGLIKACFGVPGDCVSQNTCDALVTIVSRENKFEFEMLGRGSGYVAVGLSENKYVDKMNVTTCALVNKTVVKLYQFWKREVKLNSSLDSNNGFSLTNSFYVDGTMYCKFQREKVTQVDGVRYDFKNKKYFVSLATGKLNTYDGGKGVSFNDVKFQTSLRSGYLSDVSGFKQMSISAEPLKLVYNYCKCVVDLFNGVFYFLNFLM